MPHDHPGPHPHRPDDDHPLTPFQQMEIAVRELLIERGITTAAEIAAEIDAMDARSPATGARLVARAWTDPDFAGLLARDAPAACRAMDIDIGPLNLVALFNDAEVHNVVVCTLCSCYPRDLLGLPPDWYKSRAYRSRTVKEPRRVLSEFGVTLPGDTTVRVHDSTANMRYVVIPNRPAGTEALDEAALAALVTRDSMIGTGLPRAPS